MKLVPLFAWPLLFLSVLPACQASAPEPMQQSRGTIQVELSDLPPSSMVALVRVLETLDALRAPGVEVRIRALECDSLPARAADPAHVRVILDLSFYAQTREQAEKAAAAILAGLEEEARARGRSPKVSQPRVRRVFETMPWNAPQAHSKLNFAGRSMYSNSINVDIYASLGEAHWPAIEQAPSESSSQVETYIRGIANGMQPSLAPLRIDLFPHRLRGGRTDLRYRVQAARQDDSFTRGQIGRFLTQLEAGSPGVRITHLEISPVDPGQDLRYDLWGFEFDLTLRLRTTPAKP